MGLKTRLWCFTNFVLDFNYQEYLDETTAEYVAYSLETCPKTKRKHHQGFVYFNGARGSIKGVAKQLGKCNVRPCKGNIDQNEDYCSKDGTLIEFGVKPKQGFRNDLEAIKESILEQKLSVDDICVENPNLYHQYGRTLNKLEDIALRKRFRTEMTKCEWLYGPTGVGKSHRAFENYSPETHYLYPNDGGWWDGYTGQAIVIINEFRGAIIFSELLELIDKWPKTVRRRGREPVPFLAKLVIITSSMRPSKVYKDIKNKDDSISQLMRRIKLVKMEQKWSGGNTDAPDNIETSSDEEWPPY